MELKPIEDEQLRDHLETISSDGLEIFVLERGNYRGAIVHASAMVNQMRVNHELGVLETLLLGHAYIAAALLSCNLKGQDRIGVELTCDGPAEGFSVEVDASAAVRGYLHRVPIEVSAPVESFDPAPFIGGGVLAVTKYLEDAKQPFVGKTPLQYGSPAQDLALYFTQSEQTPTAFNLSVQFDRDGRVVGAGGLMIQAFPGAESAVGEKLDETVRHLDSLGTLFAGGDATEAVITREFAAYEPIVLGTRTPRFSCRCSKRRFADFLAALPIDEIKDIRDNGPFPLRTTCHNCNTTYEFTRAEVENAYDMAR